MAKYRISGVPICDNGKLIGIITNRDMKFETDMNQLIDDVMTKENLVTAPEGITLEEAKEILRQPQNREAAPGGQGLPPQGPDHHQGHREGRGSTPTPPSDEQGPPARAAPPSASPPTCWTGWPLWWRPAWTCWTWTPPTATPRTCWRRVKRIKALYPERPADRWQRGHRRGHPRPHRGGRRLREGGHRPRLHLHHPRGGRHRRAADHRHLWTPPAWPPSMACPSSPTAASSTPAISSRPSPPARSVRHDRLPAGRLRGVPRRDRDLSGPPVQGLPRHGLPGRHEPTAPRTATSRRTTRSWCPRAWRAACPTRDSASDTIYQLMGGLRAGMGYCRLPHHRGAAAERPVHADHRRRPAESPTPTTSTSPRKLPTIPSVLTDRRARAATAARAFPL